MNLVFWSQDDCRSQDDERRAGTELKKRKEQKDKVLDGVATAASTRPSKGAPASLPNRFLPLRYQHLVSYSHYYYLGSGRESGDDLDNRPKHSEGISCRPKQECEGLESEERLRQFKCVF